MAPIGNRRLTWVCLRLGFELVKRDPRKYAPIAIAIFSGGWGIERWRVRLTRATYFYFRYLDDVADGERSCSTARQLFLEQQCSRWSAAPETSDGKSTAAEILLNFIWTEFGRRNLPLSRCRFFGRQIIEGLQFDLERGSSRRLVRRAKLDEYYARVVLAPACLAHLILDAHADPERLEEISGLIGRLQSVRDLAADWTVGVINVPREDFELNRAQKDLVNWREREISQCSTRLRALWEQWPLHADKRSCAILRPAVCTLMKWAARDPSRQSSMPIGEIVLVRC